MTNRASSAVRDLSGFAATLALIVLLAMPPKSCSHSEDSPASAPVDILTGPLVVIAADNQAKVYVEGREVGVVSDWGRPLILETQSAAGATLVAVEATNQGGPAGLLGMRLRSLSKGASGEKAQWRCSLNEEPGWTGLDFDDGGWAVPTWLTAYGSPPWGMLAGLDLRGAEWVWTEGPDAVHPIIYCRWRLSPAFDPDVLPPSPSPHP